jgi:hypothetical protein
VRERERENKCDELKQLCDGFCFAICLNSYQAQHLVFVFPDIRQITNSRIGDIKILENNEKKKKKKINQSTNM